MLHNREFLKRGAVCVVVNAKDEFAHLVDLLYEVVAVLIQEGDLIVEFCDSLLGNVFF